jgi:hypothetical protein
MILYEDPVDPQHGVPVKGGMLPNKTIIRILWNRLA